MYLCMYVCMYVCLCVYIYMRLGSGPIRGFNKEVLAHFLAASFRGPH